MREDITALIKERADIVQIIGECVELKKSGARYLGLCPFHGEKTPSFSVHSGQQFFHCFGCGESGDVFSFMMKYHNLDFPAALKELARRYHVELPERPMSEKERKQNTLKKIMFEVNQKAVKLYRDYLCDPVRGKIARDYLADRAIPQRVQEHFSIGYAPAVEATGWDYLRKQLNTLETEAAEAAGLLVKKEKGGFYDRFRDRVMFPIRDVNGRVLGFGGRIIGEGQPKYLNSPESLVFTKGSALLGLFEQRDAIRRTNQAVLVEGNFDLISLVVHGCENVVAPLGTALTRAQVRLLKRFAQEAVLLFDGDDAGRKAAIRCVPYFFGEQLKGRVAILPKGHDPDTFVQEQGVEELNRLIAEAQELPEFVLGELIQEHGMGLDGKSRIVEELRPLVKAASSSLQRSVVISHFSEKLGISVEDLTTSLAGEMSLKHHEAPPEPVASAVEKKVEVVKPLSSQQKKLVGFMLMNPGVFQQLEEVGIRENLAGGIGEIIFLQMKNMLTRAEEFHPEEILPHLSEGAERKVVSEFLLDASATDAVLGDEGIDAEQQELIAWLKRERLQNRSKKLTQEIAVAQSSGDFSLVEELLREKQTLARQLQEE